ncbi:MAG: hypothetical protein ABI706_20125 [Ilumatobacteraceae bacterium]
MTRGGLELVAGLSQIHSQRTAWVNARCNTTWTRCTVPGVSGRPSRPPHREQQAVHVVDVDRRQLGDPDVAEQRFEMMLDDAAGLRQSGRRPRRQRLPHPPIKKISHRAGTQPSIAGIFDKLAETGAGMAARAVNGLARPPFTTTVVIHTEIDTQLPRIRAALSQ